ncbi:hypothetical protein QIH36_28025, partial [Klebsiella pneumoniae]|nr:hypothetical protein [Klebsiella pneumoniae]
LATSIQIDTPSNTNQQQPSTRVENIPQQEKQITITDGSKDKINIAILIGISDYGSQSTNLPQCENDVSLA